MKTFIFISFLIISSLSSAQENSIRVLYKPVIEIDFDAIEGPKEFISYYKRSIDKAKYLSFELISNNDNSISLFKEIDNIDFNLSEIDKITLSSEIDLTGVFTNLNGKYLIHDYFLESENLKVKIENSISWTLTQEKKNIMGYECIKAKGIALYGKNKGGQIEAWFTTSIPLNYGPGFYTGLPGLILEIKNDKIRLEVTEINLCYNAKKHNITDSTIPTKNSLITTKQADSISNVMNERAEKLMKF